MNGGVNKDSLAIVDWLLQHNVIKSLLNGGGVFTADAKATKLRVSVIINILVAFRTHSDYRITKLSNCKSNWNKNQADIIQWN